MLEYGFNYTELLVMNYNRFMQLFNSICTKSEFDNSKQWFSTKESEFREVRKIKANQNIDLQSLVDHILVQENQLTAGIMGRVKKQKGKL